MKHIKRKLLFETDTDSIRLEGPEFERIDDIEKGIDPSILSEKKEHVAFLQLDGNKTTRGFVINVHGKNYILPIPDLTLVYFSNAQNNLNLSKNFKKELLAKLDLEKPGMIPPIHELYNYYGTVCSVIINLFTAIESFTNQLIPTTYVYRRITKKSTELFDHKQILENIDFKTKVKEIIPEITSKNFFGKNSPTVQKIWNLKDFRDEIVHTKPEDDTLLYRDLIKKALNYKYDDAVTSVAKYLNYYKNNYVIECDCGVDF